MWRQLSDKHTIVIYDGTCGFCNAYIQFILNNKPSKQLKFVSSQSEIGQEMVQELEIQGFETSIIVVQKQQYYKKSKAILLITEQLGTVWKCISYFKVIPTILLDFFYDVFSKNRYRLSGKYCRLITKEEQSFFL